MNKYQCYQLYTNLCIGCSINEIFVDQLRGDELADLSIDYKLQYNNQSCILYNGLIVLMMQCVWFGYVFVLF